jgi:hypothetical protein
MVKGDKKVKREEDNKPKKSDGIDLTSANLQKMANLYNRTSNYIIGSREEELRRQEQRQKLIQEILANEGLNK